MLNGLESDTTVDNLYSVFLRDRQRIIAFKVCIGSDSGICNTDCGKFHGTVIAVDDFA